MDIRPPNFTKGASNIAPSKRVEFEVEKPIEFDTWPKVQGSNKRHMAAGGNETPESTSKMACLDNPDIEKVLKDVHHAFKILFFTKDQMTLLTTDNFLHVLFLCDFGAGKEIHNI